LLVYVNRLVLINNYHGGRAIMGGTKIIVLKLQQIIKSFLMALAGLILIALLVFFLIPKNKSKNSGIYIPGTYSSEFTLHNKPINIEVSVDKNKIYDINISNLDDYHKVFYPFIEPVMQSISQEVISNQNLDITLKNDYAFTERMLLSAISSAVNKAYNITS
jgi:uncharacterized protein with FMN-binding domain